MATFTTKITPGKIEQELTFDGGVIRETYTDDGEYFTGCGSLHTKLASLYPNDEKLKACVLTISDNYESDLAKAEALAELQAIEDEYAKEKEETACTTNS